MHYALSRAALPLLVLLYALPVAAQRASAPQADPHHAPSMHFEDENIVGLKATALNVLNHPAPEQPQGLFALGATLFYERSIIHQWLEVEISASALFANDHSVVPFDLLFKTPAGFSHVFIEPYLGLGPSLDLIVQPSASHWYSGLLAAAGIYFWFAGSLGLDLDLTYSLLLEHHPSHELLTSVGLVMHF